MTYDNGGNGNDDDKKKKKNDNNNNGLFSQKLQFHAHATYMENI